MIASPLAQSGVRDRQTVLEHREEQVVTQQLVTRKGKGDFEAPLLFGQGQEQGFFPRLHIEAPQGETRSAGDDDHPGGRLGKIHLKRAVGISHDCATAAAGGPGQDHDARARHRPMR
jgi:hypothetical protein